jgi:uncharacterized protein (DUF1697 family)
MKSPKPETYIAILRGINVSGQKKINMKELKELLANLEFQAIKTYIQSGNVVFNYDPDKSDKVASEIELAIKNHYGFDVTVLIRTRAELLDCIKANPFNSKPDLDSKQLYATFLSHLPEAQNIEKVLAFESDADEFILLDKTIFVYCPGGYGTTKLSNNFFENKLKVRATTRNWRTINELSRIAQENFTDLE